jgi:hypothetical protein
LAVTQAIDDLRSARGDVQTTALLHLGNDPSDYVTKHLRSAIEGSGILNLHDQTFAEKLRNGMILPQPTFGELASALARGKELGVQTVIFGKINSFESSQNGARIDFDLSMASVETGRVLLSRNFTRQLLSGAPISSGGPATALVQEQVQSMHPAQRFLGWVLIVLLLPVFTITFLRAMVRKESNRFNAFTLMVYTAADALLAFLLLGAALTGWFSVLVFIAAVGAALAYNFYIMNFALKLET